MLIESVEKDSIAYELGLSKGDRILTVNGVKPKDILEYSFLVQEEDLTLNVKKADGEFEMFEIEKDLEDDLGVSFESIVFDGIKPCVNKCIFCFVDQQPKGLRDSLYVKDDDWRLSYFQGTYITFTNFTDTDWERLSTLRLSPLYVSIHSTNSEVRSKMLNNKRAGNILEVLDRLKEFEIEIHAQIVLCPGYNDKEELGRTLEDLKKYKKILKSLAIVPVGVSKYGAENLKTVDKTVALDTIERIEKFNLDRKRNIAMASDEIFLTAERKIPDKKYYGKFAQVEDGVGAMRLFLDSYEKCIKKLDKLSFEKFKGPKKLTLVTGSSAYKLFKSFDIKVKNLEFEVLEAKNEFFGDKINVAGLLVGEDILKTLEGCEVQNLILPSVMFKEGTEDFLDNLTLDDVRQKTGAKVFVVKDCYDFCEILAIIKSI